MQPASDHLSNLPFWHVLNKPQELIRMKQLQGANALLNIELHILTSDLQLALEPISERSCHPRLHCKAEQNFVRQEPRTGGFFATVTTFRTNLAK